MAESRWNPWRALRARDHLTLRWGRIEGSPGMIVGTGATATIWLDDRLDQAHRNATLAHELVHDERGLPHPTTPPPVRAKEEAIVRREATRRLVPMGELSALASAGDTLELWEIAEYFGVPEATAQAAVELFNAR